MKTEKVKKYYYAEEKVYSKNLFSSRTFQGGVIAFISAISIPLTNIVFDKTITKQDVLVITGAITGLVAVTVGRMEADIPTHTPHGLPGANEEEFIPTSLEESEIISETDVPLDETNFAIKVK